MILFNHKIDCYDSIYTLPVFNWWMGHKENDVSYVMHARKRVNKKQSAFLQTIWKSIYDQYIDRYGFSDDLLDILRKRVEIAKLKVLRAKGVATADTDIDIAELDLQKMLDEAHSEDNFFASKPAIQHILGYQINIKTTSVAEYMDCAETAKQMATKKAS